MVFLELCTDGYCSFSFKIFPCVQFSGRNTEFIGKFSLYRCGMFFNICISNFVSMESARLFYISLLRMFILLLSFILLYYFSKVPSLEPLYNQMLATFISLPFLSAWKPVIVVAWPSLGFSPADQPISCFVLPNHDEQNAALHLDLAELNVTGLVIPSSSCLLPLRSLGLRGEMTQCFCKCLNFSKLEIFLNDFTFWAYVVPEHP